MSEASANIVAALASQMVRVAIIREHYREVEAAILGQQAADRRVRFTINMAPATALMTAALENAHRAASSGDILEISRAIKDLEGFKE